MPTLKPLLACFAAQVAWAQMASHDIERPIPRVMSNLRAHIVIKGDNSTRTLADRMRELNVPGISVAVIHQGKIEWARGFGVHTINGLPVTLETLFQAATISKPLSALAALRLVE